MNQATTSVNTHPVDLEALRLQLVEDGKVYNNPDSKDGRKRLIYTLKTNDCREIIAAVVHGDDLASAFVWAGNRNHVDILEAFLNHGMNINIKNNNGWTALMKASCEEHRKSIRFLLDRHASVDVQNNGGYTALMHASQCGDTNLVQLLLEKNANPDLQDKNGWTVLIWASSYGRKEIVQLLLNHNADIELKNEAGQTALDLAANETIKEMIRNHVATSYILK